MDITLERILSLIPQKENGDFKHGAFAEFARKLGFKNGQIVSEWIGDKSKSYYNYLYQISAVYDVSVEWLKGETDEKSPPPAGDGLSAKDLRLIEWFRSLPPEKQKAILISQDAPEGLV